MAYDIKNVFYLDTELTLETGTGVGKSDTVQLDLSAYIDPIARGRTKGTGLAIYKVHYSVSAASEGATPIGTAESGIIRAGLIAGAGLGSQTNATLSGTANSPTANNALAVMGFDYYGPDAFAGGSFTANQPSVGPMNRTFLEPSKDVPYVCVRDNVCLVSTALIAVQSTSYISMRLECAQVQLDQATLNQLLRTQTV